MVRRSVGGGGIPGARKIAAAFTDKGTRAVVAMQGDTVQVSDRGVVVNGTLLSNSSPLGRDSDGRPLPRPPMTLHILTADEVWLVSSHSVRSYDSRYFGPVAASRVIAVIEGLITAP